MHLAFTLLVGALVAPLALTRADAKKKTNADQVAVTPSDALLDKLTTANITSANGTTVNSGLDTSFLPPLLPVPINSTVNSTSTTSGGASSGSSHVHVETTMPMSIPTNTSSAMSTSTEMANMSSTTIPETTTQGNSSAVIVTSFSAVTLCVVSLMIAT